MPDKIYQVGETAITFDGTVGADVAFSIESVVNDAGRQSALHDLGVLTDARASRFIFRFFTQLQATPTVRNTIRLFRKTSDGSHPDNDDGTGDAAISSIDKLLNLTLIAILKVDEAAANIETVVSGEITILDRHVGFAIWNTSGATINATDSNSGVILTPLPPEIQTA